MNKLEKRKRKEEEKKASKRKKKRHPSRFREMINTERVSAAALRIGEHMSNLFFEGASNC